jgi:hypothetical protein
MSSSTLARLLAAASLALLVGAPIATASAVQFAPFSKVKDVCPSCPKRATDTITMDDNSKVQGRVVAQNDMFFVVSRFGELRTVPSARVMSIDWANGNQPPGLLSQDQILLRTGVVLTGNIIEEKDKPAYYRLQSSINNQTYVVFKNQAESVFKGGKLERP